MNIKDFTDTDISDIFDHIKQIVAREQMTLEIVYRLENKILAAERRIKQLEEQQKANNAIFNQISAAMNGGCDTCD